MINLITITNKPLSIVNNHNNLKWKHQHHQAYVRVSFCMCTCILSSGVSDQIQDVYRYLHAQTNLLLSNPVFAILNKVPTRWSENHKYNLSNQTFFIPRLWVYSCDIKHQYFIIWFWCQDSMSGILESKALTKMLEFHAAVTGSFLHNTGHFWRQV